jgi:hypothetical protein
MRRIAVAVRAIDTIGVGSSSAARELFDIDYLPGRRLPQLLEAIKTAGFAGANVTYPFKQEIIPLLDTIDASAAEVGAVNTITIAPDGRTTGFNFDRSGWRNSFVATLGQGSALGKTVVQVGAGRAVSFALLVFPQLFFPSANPNTAIVASLATYGVGYVARPVGAGLTPPWILATFGGCRPAAAPLCAS